jgi:hypothetical protein
VEEGFQVWQWRALVVPHIERPEGAHMKSAVDLSMTSVPDRSDRTAIATGFTDDELYAIPEAGLRMNLIDLRVGHWRGLKLVNEIVDNIQTHQVEQTNIESIPGADLVEDCITLLAGSRNVTTGRIRLFKRDTRPNAKVMRIRKLQEVVDRRCLRIQDGPFVPELLRVVEAYTFTKIEDDDGLDALCFLCFGPRN